MKQKRYDYPNARKLKVFLVSLLDTAVMIFGIFLLFTLVATPIMMSTSTYKDYKSSSSRYYAFMADTHLYQLNDDKLVDVADSGAKYVEALVKTTYYYNGLDYIVDNQKVTINANDCLNYVQAGSYPNDNLAEYYLNYRNVNNNDTTSQWHTTAVKEFYKSFVDWNSVSLYLDGQFLEKIDSGLYVADGPIINEQTAKTLFKYINYQDDASKDLYVEFVSLYKDAVSRGTKQLSNDFANYNQVFNDMIAKQKAVYSMQFLSLALCYLFMFGVYFVMIPLLMKKGRTLSIRYYKLEFRAKNGEYTNKHTVKRFCGQLFTQLGATIPTVMMSLATPILYSKLIFGFSFVFIFIAFFVVSMVSFIVSMSTKDHQGIADLIAGVYLIDTSLTIEVQQEEDQINENSQETTL